MDIFDIALSATPRVGGRTAAHLIETFFSAENIFSQSYENLRQYAKLNDAVAMSIVRREGFRAAEIEMNHCLRHGITPIAATDLEYPSLLRETHDPPHVIYVRGDTSILTRNLISIVGTRKVSNYGDLATKIVVKELGERIHNLVIVSGLAFGVDSVAHRAALENNIPTIAILPNPLPGVTPASHTQLAGAIIDSGGALVTELRSTSNAAGKAYISRNRVIAGVSAATIVMESGIKGGSISTARIAGDEGRIVAAVPGRITDSVAMGCNKLIADRAAMMLTSAEDLIRELKWEDRTREVVERSGVEETFEECYSEEQVATLKLFEGSDPLSIAELEMATQLPFTKLNAQLMELELMGAIRALPGSRYQSLLFGGGAR